MVFETIAFSSASGSARKGEMTKGRWLKDENALVQADRLYLFIGKYVIGFQWLESKIDEIFHLSDGHTDYEKRLAWLARQRISDKSKKLRSLVLSNCPFQTASIEGWNERFESVMDRIDSECIRRNALLHSSYLFDFLVIGQPIIQTHLEKKRMDETGFNLNQDCLTEEKQEEILIELANLSVDFGFCCTQLRFSYDETDATDDS
jgi:hypothetical protein